MERVVFSSRARADIADIWLFLATNVGLELADTKIDHVLDRSMQLARHPFIGPARPEIGLDARSLLVERWLILYQVDGDFVRVMRIVDASRDLKQINLVEDKPL